MILDKDFLNRTKIAVTIKEVINKLQLQLRASIYQKTSLREWNCEPQTERTYLQYKCPTKG